MEHIEARILDRDYTLAVAPDEKERLVDAVKLVDARMKAIRDGGRIAGVDRIAVMAALQIAHDLLGANGANEASRVSAEAIRRIRKMSEDIDRELAKQDTLF